MTGVGRRLGPSKGRGGNGVQGHGVEAGIFPRVEFWQFSQNRPPTRVSRTGSSSPRRHRGEDFDSKKEPRPSDESLYLFLVLPLRAFLVSSLSLRVFWTPAWALQIPPHPLSLCAPGQAEAAAPFSWRRPLLSLSHCSFSHL